ncbi:MAG: flagellar hook-length control protein FliK, partial [Alphaproteobacteria bacterium]|nr:flagellar hook-length control protein FliK [Alphaproteobacteria bacterium]
TDLEDGRESNSDYLPLKNLMEFMDAVESQIGQGNSKEPKALPAREVFSALSDLLVFLKALRQHLAGANGPDKVRTTSENAAIPVQIPDKIDAADLAEFEQILHDLGQFVPTGNALDGQSEDHENLDQAFTVDIIPAAVNADPVAVNTDLPMAKESPAAGGEQKIELNGFTDHPKAEELVSSVPSGGPVLRDDLDASPRRELNPANAQSEGAKPKEVLIDEPSDTSEKKVVLDNAQPVLQNENLHNTQTVQLDESKQVVNIGRAADEVKLPEEGDAKAASILAEALVPLRELVSKLGSQNPDHPFKLSQREQSKLVEATKLLRSIDFEDMSAGKNPFKDIFDGSKSVRQTENGNARSLNKERSGEDQLQSAAETDLDDLQVLEALAQSALASDPSAQDLAQIRRTSFVAFPPEISEKSIIFEMPVFLVVNEVDASNPDISHITKSEVTNTADLNLKPDEILTLPQKDTPTDALVGTRKTDFPNGDKAQTVTIGSPEQSLEKPVLDGELSRISEQVATGQATKVENMMQPSGQVPTSGVLHDGENVNHAIDRPALSVSEKSDGQLHPKSGPEVFSGHKEGNISSPSSNKTEVLAQNASQTVAAKSETGTPNLSASATETDQKSPDVSLRSAPNQRETSDQARYERPIVQSGAVNALKTEMAQSDIKDTPVLKVTESKPQTNEPLDIKDPLEKVAKTETKKTEGGTLATTKANVRTAENVNQVHAHPAENDSDESLIAKKQAAVENLPLHKKTNGQVSESKTFEIAKPKMKLLAQRPDVLPKPQTITDFSARAVEAMVNQNLGTVRTIASHTSTTVPFAVQNAETGTVQQASSTSNPQNMGGQMQSGAERLEKWIDGRLDLTSRGWVNNLAKTMASAINRGQQRLMLALSPPSLGRINIVFNARSAGLDVRIHAEKKATLSLLGDAQAKLVSNLENAGHKVNNLSYAEM